MACQEKEVNVRVCAVFGFSLFSDMLRNANAAPFVLPADSIGATYMTMLEGNAGVWVEVKVFSGRESLAGRALRHLMLPLSLAERAWPLDGPEIMIAKHLQNQMKKMLAYGGYPTVVLSSQPEKELAGLVEAFIIRYASDRFRIRHPAAF
jgi:hypothetical protein